MVIAVSVSIFMYVAADMGLVMVDEDLLIAIPSRTAGHRQWMMVFDFSAAQFVATRPQFAGKWMAVRWPAGRAKQSAKSDFASTPADQREYEW